MEGDGVSTIAKITLSHSKAEGNLGVGYARSKRVLTLRVCRPPYSASFPKLHLLLVRFSPSGQNIREEARACAEQR